MYSFERPHPIKSFKLIIYLLNYQISVTVFQTIQEHFHHSVSKEARALERELGPVEADISGLLETSIDDVRTCWTNHS